MKKRYFFLIYLNNNLINTIVNGIRLLSDYNQRNFAHLTLKGPYSTNQINLLKKDEQLIKGEIIKITDVDSFFYPQQNTVFFKCKTPDVLFDIWKKQSEKTFNVFNPHITLYDGDNRAFASKLLSIVSKYNISFDIVIEKLELYSSSSLGLFNLRTEIDYNLLGKIIKFDINQNNIAKISVENRLLFIERLASELSKHNGSKEYKLPPTKAIRNMGLVSKSKISAVI